MSGPGWSTILTGVWPDKHKVKENSFAGNVLAANPSWLARAQQAKPALDTYAAVDWKPISDHILRDGQDRKFVVDGDSQGYVASDEKVAVDAERHLGADPADASFVYFGQTDIAGHEHGADSAQYAATLRTDDALIGRLLRAVESRATYGNEDWLVMLTTDHGHTPGGGHGGDTPEERMTFVVAAGGAVPAGAPAVQPKIVDIAPTALRHLGIASPAEYDGYPLGAAPQDPFDAAVLKPSGVPSNVLGWTHQGPGGWTVRTAATTPQGVAEWQGWSFTTDDFWTRTAPGQQREANARARGVFAVADPDEWDDKGSPSSKGKFDSTLLSPGYDVAGAANAVLRFVSHYRQEGSQRGAVTVSFDGGAERTVQTYSADLIAQPVALTIPVPVGVKKMVVSWRLYDAGNNWYWAVDAPSVTT